MAAKCPLRQGIMQQHFLVNFTGTIGCMLYNITCTLHVHCTAYSRELFIIQFLALDELDTCKASLVPPKQSLLSILVRLSYVTQLTITLQHH